MSLYQRVLLSTGETVGAPAPLPADLVGGLTDDDLAVLGTLEPAAHYAGYGFIRVPDPEPEPPPVSRWVHKAIFKRRFTSEERIAIRLAESNEAIPQQARWALADFREVLDATDQVYLDDLDLIAGLGLLVTLGLLGPLRPGQIRE